MCEHCGWPDVLAEVDETLAMLDELPDQAEEFAASVEDKLEGIKAWIEEKEHATDRQVEAVQNMAAGARKWMGE
jgi:hypothetical protein